MSPTKKSSSTRSATQRAVHSPKASVAPELTTDPVKADYAPGSSVEKIEPGKTMFPDLPPALSLPVTPDWVTITPAEAVGK